MDQSKTTAFQWKMTEREELKSKMNAIAASLRESRLAMEKSFEPLRRLHKQFEDEAPRIDLLIQSMDPWAIRSIDLESPSDPHTRRMAYRITLWAQHGWFLSFHETPLSLISQTAEGLATDKRGQLESLIAKYFELEASNFIDSIAEMQPDRAHIIRDAFQAHNEERFALSIPAFLIQADGIAASVFGIDSIYTVSESNFGKIRDYFARQDKNKLSLGSTQFLIGALSPLNASRKKRANYPTGLNRHQVIHGESVTYNTRINSLKAISWVHFVTEILHYAK